MKKKTHRRVYGLEAALAGLGSRGYAGELVKPVKLRPMSSEPPAGDDAGRLSSDVARAFVQKLPLLFEHFNVTVGDWPALVMALASEHVPGFRLKRFGGRPRKWDAASRALMKNLVDAEIARDPRLTVTHAARLASSKVELSGMNPSPEVVRTQYYKARGEDVDALLAPQQTDQESVTKPLSDQSSREELD